MSEPQKERASYGALVLVVGPDTPTEQELSRRLINRGHSVVVCAGPPGCPLVRGEQCAIGSVADAVVVMPNEAHDRETLAGLSLCIDRARRALVIEPSLVSHEARVQHVPSIDAAAIALPAVLSRS
jgi:hypothetical protein